ncbi:MAG: CRTAC1 family protein [Bacteroidota bacterium]|nr:CRTAC1 family protein [Bacteroidota bacterium]
MNRLLVVLLVGIAPMAGCGPEESAQTDMSAPISAPIQLTEITAEAGLGAFRHETGAFGQKWFPETMGAGAGFLDYDNDGWQDILLVAGGTFDESPPDALRLYRNSGRGRFDEVTGLAGLAGLKAYAFGITAADYDNDGDTDVFVTTLSGNLFLRNLGGHFEEVARDVGLGGTREWSSAAVFFDADRDGWLDLYVGNYVDWSPEKDIWCSRVGDTKAYCTPELYSGIGGRFYRNLGDGTFTEMLQEFADLPGKTLGAISLDYNRDNWPDLVVANDTQRDLLFENLQNGTFSEKGMLSGIAFDENGRARAGMGIDVGVVDPTGEETVFVGHFSGEMVGVYRHSRRGFFADRAAVSQIGHPSLRTLTFGLVLFDADLDADLDLLTANGHITEDIGEVEEGVSYRQRAQLYVNDGTGRFIEAAPEGVLADPLLARGAAWADIDQDGDADVLITENGGPLRLWRNDTKGGHYLQIRLRGTHSNRDGIGSRVVVVAGDTRQERYVRAGASYLSQSQLAPLFGLGPATAVDTLRIHWISGLITEAGPFSVNQVVNIREGE